VIVELRLAAGIKPEGGLPDPAAVATQRRAIVEAQTSVLNRLGGTRFSLIRQYATVPFLALAIGPDALTALETLGDVVARVREDVALMPGAGTAPPGATSRDAVERETGENP